MQIWINSEKSALQSHVRNSIWPMWVDTLPLQCFSIVTNRCVFVVSRVTRLRWVFSLFSVHGSKPSVHPCTHLYPPCAVHRASWHTLHYGTYLAWMIDIHNVQQLLGILHWHFIAPYTLPKNQHISQTHLYWTDGCTLHILWMQTVQH